MDNLLRILDRFPETLDALPGAPQPRTVAGVGLSRTRKRADADMSQESGEKYKGNGEVVE